MKTLLMFMLMSLVMVPAAFAQGDMNGPDKCDMELLKSDAYIVGQYAFMDGVTDRHCWHQEHKILGIGSILEGLIQSGQARHYSGQMDLDMSVAAVLGMKYAGIVIYKYRGETYMAKILTSSTTRGAKVNSQIFAIPKDHFLAL